MKNDKSASRRCSDPARLGELLQRLMMTVGQRSSGEGLRLLAESGLTIPQVITLHLLVHLGELPVTAIARLLKLAPATLSHLVERLVQARLEHRREGAADRRQRRVEINPSGRAVLKRLDQARGRDLEEVLGTLPPDLCRRFEEILEQVVETLAVRAAGKETHGPHRIRA
jgi:DNA-binding MarR family transcriptional regulator